MAHAVTMLFLGKADDELCSRAAQYLRLHTVRTEVHYGKRGDPWPAIAHAEFDYLVSYLSPWVVPAYWLGRAREAAINFHPGPPEYPGIGCTNFAIYDQVMMYGITCHHMTPTPDTGAIIRAIRFPIYDTETVLSLTNRSYAYLAWLFYEIIDAVLAGRALPVAAERWTRRPFRRAALDALCRLTPDMSEGEVARRVRATTFPGYPTASMDPVGTGTHQQITKEES